jgi:hypothetical protein
MKPVLAFLIVVFLSGITGCGDREQIMEPQSEKRYQGKQDGKPWDNAPLAAEFRGGTWTKGNQQSWEEQIKQRQLGQHEHKRIYQ